jgi:four helix bundle protein
MIFENMDVWKRSRVLAIEIYREMAQLRDFGFKDQITRSALSVPSNIAGGLERGSNPDKCRFIEHTKGSVGELRTQIDIGIEIGYKFKRGHNVNYKLFTSNYSLPVLGLYYFLSTID